MELQDKTVLSLQKRIALLPQSVQILISEFNVEHRPLFQKIHREYFTLIYPACRICAMPFDKPFCSIDYFIIHKFKLDCHWCGLDCFEKDTDRDLKMRCLMAVKEYVE